MVVKFKDGLYNNYNQQNMIDILSVASMNNPLIYNLMMDPYAYILVDGDIHRSQWTADNTSNNYWFKIKGFTADDFPIAELKAAHIYVCFRNFTFNYMTQQYGIDKSCYNPAPYKGTDIADIDNLNGVWAFVNITYGLSPKTFFKQSNKKTPIKKRVKKVLQIIDPKTGKPIKIGETKQKGGGLFTNKKLEKVNNKLEKENKKIKEELKKLKEENKKIKKEHKEERKKRYDCLYDLKQLTNPKKKIITGISDEEVRIINKFLKLQNKNKIIK